MPVHKDFKRLVRARMQKTGESYTAARSHLLRNRSSNKSAIGGVTPVAPSAAQYAMIAGLSDAAVKKGTGCTWDRWVRALDRVDAHTWPHRRIARYIHDKYATPDWWAQMVTVGYERIKGLRARGQQRDGSYEASRTKTLPVAVTTLYHAFDNSRTRARWLTNADAEIRRATRNKSMRLTFADGTSALVGFFAKGAKKSQVAVQHTKLRSAAEAAERRAFWGARFQALAGTIAG